MKKSLHDYPFVWGLIMIGVPIACQNLLITSMSAIDTIMVSTQGELAVSAVGVCNQYNQLFNSALYGFNSAGSLFIAQYWGAKDHKGISRAYGLMMVTMLLFGALFIAPAIFAPQAIMRIFTDKAAIAEMGVRYLRLAGHSYLFQCLVMGISTFLRSIERVRLPLIASIAAVLMNTGLNWVLISGHLGFPALGIEGAAIATILSNVTNFLIVTIVCLVKRCPYMWDFRDIFSWGKGFLQDFGRKTLPIFSNEMLVGLATAIINMALGRQQEEAIAALAVFRVLEGFIMAFFMGFFTAATVMVGKKVGAGELRDSMCYAKRFAWVCPLFSLIPCLLLVMGRGVLPGFFSLSPLAGKYLGTMLLIYLIAGPLRMSNYIQNATYRAGGQAVYGTVLELLAIFLISVPLVWITGVALKLSFMIVFAAIFVEEIIKIFIETRYTLSGRWISPVTAEGKKALEREAFGR